MDTVTPVKLKYDVSSILVIRMSGIGDILWSTPLLANLRHYYPKARIGYITRPFCAPVLMNNPAVDDIILFDDERIRKQIGFLRRLHRKHFDLSIDLICSPGTAIQSVVSGADVRIGFDYRIRRHLYNRVLSRTEANRGHEAEFDLYVLREMELPVVTTDLVWRVSSEERADADEQWRNMGLSENGVVVGLVPTGGYPQKKWPVEYYAEFAAASSRLGDAQFLAVWGNETEHADCETIRRIAGDHVKVAPKSHLRRTGAFLERCSMVIGNDSGPFHISTALNRHVIGLYGHADMTHQGPFSPHAVTIQSDACVMEERHCIECGNPVCMTEIKPAQVVTAARTMLGL